MFDNGIPDTLPEGYGKTTPVESFTQTPGEIKAAEKFIKSADGVITSKPKGPNPQIQRVPASEDFVAFPKRLRSTPWAPKAPYVGKELAEIVSDTPFNRGTGVPVNMVQPDFSVQQEYKPMYSGIAHRGYSGSHSYGSVPDSPLREGDKDGWFNKSVSKLQDSLTKAGIGASSGKRGEFSAATTSAIKSFQAAWNDKNKGNADLQLNVNGVYDRATELALRATLGEDLTKAGGGMTGKDWIAAGAIGTELFKLFKPAEEDTGIIIEAPVQTGPKIWPIVTGIVVMGALIGGLIWATRKDDDDE